MKKFIEEKHDLLAGIFAVLAVVLFQDLNQIKMRNFSQ